MQSILFFLLSTATHRLTLLSPIPSTRTYSRHSLLHATLTMAPLYMLIYGFLLSSSLHTSPAAMANGGDTLSAGQPLVVGDKLISRNGKFALGFFQFQPAPETIVRKSNTLSSSSSLGWYLGIWFSKIPVFTPVWIANRERPITDPEQRLTQLKISRDGNLIIAILNNASSTDSLSPHFGPLLTLSIGRQQKPAQTQLVPPPLPPFSWTMETLPS